MKTPCCTGIHLRSGHRKDQICSSSVWNYYTFRKYKQDQVCIVKGSESLQILSQFTEAPKGLTLTISTCVAPGDSPGMAFLSQLVSKSPEFLGFCSSGLAPKTEDDDQRKVSQLDPGLPDTVIKGLQHR